MSFLIKIKKYFSNSFKKDSSLSSRGFTIIEMLVVFAIITFLTTIIVYRYGKFNSQINLINMANELALVIREAQLSSITYAQRIDIGDSSLSTDPYGIFISTESDEEQSLIKVYSDENNDFVCSNPNGVFCLCDGDECKKKYELTGNIKIKEIFYDQNFSGNLGVDCSTATFASILFKRPSPEPILIPEGEDPEEIEYMQIVLEDIEGNTMHIGVNSSGAISILNDSDVRCKRF